MAVYLFIAAALPLPSLAQDEFAFDRNIDISGGTEFRKQLLSFTKNGWELVTFDGESRITKNNAGGMFSTHTEYVATLARPDSGESMICLMFGGPKGGLDASVTYAMTCTKGP